MAKNKSALQKVVAVVGGGWAGAAAAVNLAQHNHKVHWIEASRQLGGRARAVELHGKILDNGQHILLGAYTSCLALFKTLNITVEESLLRLPLQMVYPNQSGMHFVAPKLPAPLHLAFALFKAQGLDRADKMALARFSTTARWMDWQLNDDCSVAELLQRYEQTARLIQLMWNPLCIAALNTPPERASAKVFLAVLRDSLGAKRSASDMLLPTTDLSALMPHAAAQFIQNKAGHVHLGTTAHSIHKTHPEHWCIESSSPEINAMQFDAIVLATPAETSKRFLAQLALDQHDQVSPNHEALIESHKSVSLPEFPQDLSYESITTCYLQYPSSFKLARPFFALVDNPNQHCWGQFVFDRGQLHQAQQGLLAVVVSAAVEAIAIEREALALQIAAQLAHAFAAPELANPLWHQVISEKRATFSCTPNLQRPANQTSHTGLVLAGDYTACDYPATLESAVRSGIAAAQLLS